MRPVCALLALCVLSATVRATTVRQATFEELAARATLVVRATVSQVGAHPSERFWRQTYLEVREVLKGAAEEVLTLDLPGGHDGALELRVPLVPAFAVGDDVVLLLERMPRGFVPVGLVQGVFFIEGDLLRRPELTQPLWAQRRAVGYALAPTTLAALRAELRSR